MTPQITATNADVTVTLTYAVTGAGPLTKNCGSTKQYIPDHAYVRVWNGKTVKVSVAGPTLLKGNRPSGTSWQIDRYTRGHWLGHPGYEECPEWVAHLVAQAELQVNTAGLVPSAMEGTT